MILDLKPLSIIEAAELAGENKETEGFIKKFAKIKEKEAVKLREELENLNLAKLKDEHIAKIIDILPEDIIDLNKIFIDISLEEDENNKILELIKKYK